MIARVRRGGISRNAIKIGVIRRREERGIETQAGHRKRGRNAHGEIIRQPDRGRRRELNERRLREHRAHAGASRWRRTEDRIAGIGGVIGAEAADREDTKAIGEGRLLGLVDDG